MNEGSGDRVYDLSGNGNDGTFVSSPPWKGGGLDLDGNADYVNAGSNQPLRMLNDEVTLAVLVNLDTWAGVGKYEGFASVWETTANKRAYSLSLFGEEIRGLVSSDGTWNEGQRNEVSISVPDLLGRIVSLVMTFDPTNNIRLYENGVELPVVEDLTEGTVINQDGGDFLIGAHWVGGVAARFIDGTVYHCFAYNRALTPDEISQLHIAPYQFFEQPRIWAVSEEVSTVSRIVIPRPPQQKPLLGTQLNRSHPLARGLVGAWVMNEGSGDRVNDLSGNGGVGTLVGATWVAGNPSVAQAVTDRIQLDTLSDGWIPTPQGTISCMAYKEWADNDNAEHQLFGFNKDFGGNPDGNNQIAILKWSNNSLYAGWYYNTTEYRIVIADGNFSLPQNQWNHLVLTWNDTTNMTYLYINGVQVGSNNSLIIGSIGSHASILNYPSAVASYGWDGEVNDFLVYNKALTPTEVQLLHISPYAMLEQPVIWVGVAAEEEGRTTLNTDPWNLGQQHGMSFRMVT